MKAKLLMAGSAICFSTIGVLVKLIGNNIPVMSLSFFRVFFAFLFLAVIMLLFNRSTFKETRKDLEEYLGIGVLIALTLTLYNAANLFAPVQNAVLLSFTSPFFVLIFARYILKEKITRTKIISLSIAFLGLIIINPFSSGFLLGNSFALLNAVGFGLLITLMRKENQRHSIGDVMWFFFFASVVLSPFVFIYGVGNFSESWHYMILLGVISTGLAYLLNNLAMKELEAEIASIISVIITPLGAILLAFLVLSENIQGRIILGGALLILAGIYLEWHNFGLRMLGNHIRK